jgi:hypothetical protein
MDPIAPINPLLYPIGTYFERKDGVIAASNYDDCCRGSNYAGTCVLIAGWYYGFGEPINFPNCMKDEELSLVSVPKTLKLYLDDQRPTPPGWARFYWPDEMYPVLEKGIVTHISLDHDLGDDERGKGIDVIDWLKDKIEAGWTKYPKNVAIHSDNGPGRQYIEQAVHSLNRLIERKNTESIAPEPNWST